MISKGDIVVLVKDNKSNCVRDFQRFIGAVGEVVHIDEDGSSPYVKFDEGYDNKWYYSSRKLFKLGSTK